jgi:hypothetical protein
MNEDPMMSSSGVVVAHGKKQRIHFWFVWLLWFLPCVITAQVLIPMRTYTNMEGRKIDAEVLWIRDGNVALKTIEGRTYVYPMGNLSPGDQHFLNSYSGKASAPAASAAWSLKNSAISAPKKTFNATFPTTERRILAYVGFFIIVCSSLALIVAAFQEGLGWGLATMFVPFAALVFTVQYWHEAKKPFLWSLAGTLLIFLAGSA